MKLFILENGSETIICEMAAILSRGEESMSMDFRAVSILNAGVTQKGWWDTKEISLNL